MKRSEVTKPEIRGLKIGSCPSLTGKSTLTYGRCQASCRLNV
jgi:hypothetical protein